MRGFDMTERHEDVKEVITNLLGNHKFRKQQNGSQASTNRNFNTVLEKAAAVKSTDGQKVHLSAGTHVTVYRETNCASSEYLATFFPPGPPASRMGHISVFGDGTIRNVRYGPGGGMSRKNTSPGRARD